MTDPVRVAVDAMGGDRGPEDVVAGAVEAASSTLRPILYGPSGLDTKGLELVEASEEIAMHEKPVEAVRTKTNSSLVLACRAVGEGEDPDPCGFRVAHCGSLPPRRGPRA